MLAIRATTRDPEIFNNVYNAIAREAPCNGSFNDLQSARSSKPMLFRSNSLFAGSCCFLSPRKTSEILNPDVSVVKSAFSVPFFPPFFPPLFTFFSLYFWRYQRERSSLPKRGTIIRLVIPGDISTESCLVHRAN